MSRDKRQNMQDLVSELASQQYEDLLASAQIAESVFIVLADNSPEDIFKGEIKIPADCQELPQIDQHIKLLNMVFPLTIDFENS